MRISDWSSDVCSSDLHRAVIVLEAIGLCQRVAVLGQLPARDLWQQFLDAGLGELVLAALARHAMGLGEGDQIGHVGSCRRRGDGGVLNEDRKSTRLNSSH